MIMWRNDSYVQFSLFCAKWNGILDFWVLFLQIAQYACVQKYAPVPVCACACMPKPTTWPRRDRVAFAQRNVSPLLQK